MNILETVKNWWNPSQRDPSVVNVSDRELLLSTVTGEVNAALEAAGIKEAFTQADIELALDDRGWLVGGKRMAGELDPLSRQVQVNRSRYYWLRDPLAKQAVRLWTDYAFGDQAVTWDTEETPVQKKLDKFMKDRRNRKITSRAGMRRLSTKLLVDGELFFAIFDDFTIRMIDCLQMKDIVTDPDDEDTVIAYKRETAALDGGSPKILYYKPWDFDEESEVKLIDPQTKKEFVFEDQVIMYHLAFDALEKRGNPLLSACSDWSREHRRFMIARVALTQALSRFAFNMTVKGGQKAVDQVRSKLESTFAQTGLSGGTEHQPPNAPGGTWVSNEGIKLEAMPRTTGANEASADANGLKLMVSAGTGIMLHYFGDPSTGNLATATAMELPMLKMFGAYQQFWKDAWRDIFSIVLQEKPDQEQADINIELPDIIEDDLQKLGVFITQLTTVFPEAKVPAVLRDCLSSLGLQNLDEVMKDIQEKRDTIDANQQAGLMADGSPIPAPMAKPDKSVGGPSQGGAVGTNQDQTESARLIRAVERLVEVLS